MLLFVLLLWSTVNGVSCVLNVYPKIKQISIKGEPGEPLFLTPLIEAGKIDEAQIAARVGPLKGAENVTSFSGYLTVNKKFDSNMFFWFFPAEGNNYPSAPVVLWLQGGPGATSLFGLFTENGPFSVKKKLYLKRRQFSWTKTHSVIYIDNPVGTGYSFTNSDDGYARNETVIGEDLYNALLQFFQLFPELQKNEFYVTGESYAGKYIPAVSYTIHTRNPGAKQHINLKGLAIGNGLCDPEHMLKYGDYLYQIGLIDVNARAVFHEMENLGIKYIQEKKWKEAYDVFDQLVSGDLHPRTAFYNSTGFTFYFNYLHDKEEGSDALGTYIQLAKVRKAIHVGNLKFHTDSKVEEHLQQDVMQSVKPWVEILLEDYRVLIYNGQLDIIVAYPLTLGFLQTLEWSGAAAYKTAPRFQWRVGNDLAGYAKSVGHLTEVLVIGNLVLTDNHPGSLFYNLSGFTSHYNYLHDNDEGSDAMGTYIQLAKVRKAIHVGNLTFHTDSKVEDHLQQDFMQSVKPWVEILLEDYRVLIYNGQLDIIVAYPLTLGFLQALEWSGAAAYKTAPRFQWRVGNDLAGYAKSVGHLTEVLVRDAGHMVPSDQSKWAFDLINRFTADKPFHSF